MARDAASALRDLTRSVMGRPGVSGTALGEKRGKPCLKVYVSDPSVTGSLPKAFEGYPVVIETTGAFEGR
jgi:hypothetical protein